MRPASGPAYFYTALEHAQNTRTKSKNLSKGLGGNRLNKA
jgi:hypothetical protein